MKLFNHSVVKWHDVALTFGMAGYEKKSCKYGGYELFEEFFLGGWGGGGGRRGWRACVGGGGGGQREKKIGTKRERERERGGLMKEREREQNQYKFDLFCRILEVETKLLNTGLEV